MKNKLFLAGLVCLMPFVQSCNKEDMSRPAEPGLVQIEPAERSALQISFAKTLAKGLKNDPALRAFLKTEGNKQFDKDYDILYHMIKDQQVGGTQTFREKLLYYAESAEAFAAIENSLPLLTIFIPSLPDFSTEKWNTDTEIPQVAVLQEGNNNVAVFDDEGRQTVLTPDQIPAFPVLVIKQNERILVNNGTGSGKNSSGKKGAGTFHQNGRFSFSFADEAFNGISHLKEDAAARTGINNAINIDTVNTLAYNSGSEWHRDYVYYGITPTNPRGTFNGRYSEFIRSFKFLTPDALNMISDQTGDPSPRFTKNMSTSPSWTEGNFEFWITVLVNGKNGVGNEFTKVLSVRPQDLFDLAYTRVFPYYRLSTITPKEYRPEVELVPWNLQAYSLGWKFIVYERDLTEEITQTYSHTSSFATNFEINGSIGDTQKVGAKLGFTQSTSNTVSYGVKTTLGSDFLGETVLTFDQPVITSASPVPGTPFVTFTTREITTGNVLTMSIEPKRVY
ncbi:MAG: hypothetical protein ICV83_04725 [Cytophagales bacterium]|nr:hypothetical protein [Cytophagales bacterium]